MTQFNQNPHVYRRAVERPKVRYKTNALHRVQTYLSGGKLKIYFRAILNPLVFWIARFDVTDFLT